MRTVIRDEEWIPVSPKPLSGYAGRYPAGLLRWAGRRNEEHGGVCKKKWMQGVPDSISEERMLESYLKHSNIRLLGSQQDKILSENGNLSHCDMIEDCRFPYYVIYFKLVNCTVICDRTVLQIQTAFLPDAYKMKRKDGGATYAWSYHRRYCRFSF